MMGSWFASEEEGSVVVFGKSEDSGVRVVCLERNEVGLVLGRGRAVSPARNIERRDVRGV